jgi:hypothetical protein
MAAFEISIDSARTVLFLNNGGRRLGYAVVNTLNRLAKEIQAAERQHAPSIFTLRKSEFILRQLAIITFASVAKGRYEARVRVGQKPRLLLGMFEAGGVHEPLPGRTALAVPVLGGARPGLSSGIPEQLLVKNLQLTRKRGKTGQAGPVEGLAESYVVPHVGIFQRLTAAMSRILYSFRPGVRVPRELQWLTIASRIAAHRGPEILADEVDDAWRHGGSVLGQLQNLATEGVLA